MNRVLEDLRRAERRRAVVVASVLVGVLGVGLLVVLGRVIQLQVAPSEQLMRHADDRVAVYRALARRGDIRDRRGRLIAATRTGSRVFVDPARLEPVDGGYDDLLLALAQATGEELTIVADRVLSRVQENRRRLESDPGASLIRYVSIGDVLSDGQLGRARRLARAHKGIHLEEITTREGLAGNLLAAVVGKVGVDGNGLAGMEAGFDTHLRAQAGFVEPVLDARGNALWVPPSGYVPSRAGEPVRLSVDLELQRIVVEELERRVDELDAAGARCVVMDPETGEVLALADVTRLPGDAVEPGSETWRAARESGERVRERVLLTDPMRDREPALARVRCAVDVYEPGSTMKPFVWSMLVERGVLAVDDRLDTESGVWRTSYGRRIEDEAPRDEQTWAEVLINSSNIGMAKGAEMLGHHDLRGDVLRWGFGAPTGTPLPGEAAGLVTSARSWSDMTHSSVPMGYEIGVTALQVARGFSAFARSGSRAGEMPGLSLEALEPGDARLRITRRVLRPSSAEAARDAMVRVGEKMAQRTPAWIPGEERFPYTIFGKSGTAKCVSLAGGYIQGQYTTSFVAAVPAEASRLVIVVVIDDPGPEVVRAGRFFGSMTAGPTLLRIARRSLEYLGVAPDRVAEGG